MDDRARLVELAEGVYVEHDLYGVVKKIQEYDPNLRVQYCDPNLADLTDAPYRVVEHCLDGIDRVVFEVWDLDDRVLERIYAADNRKHDISAILDAKNQKAQEARNRRYKESIEEGHDIVTHFGESRKNVYTFKDDEGKVHTMRDGDY